MLVQHLLSQWLKRMVFRFPKLKASGIWLIATLPWVEVILKRMGLYRSLKPLILPPSEHALLLAYQSKKISASKQLFIDISILILGDARTGIQRVVRSLLFELIQQASTDYRIEFVYATPTRVGFYYARQFIARLLGDPQDKQLDTLIQFQRGDQLIGLDFCPAILPHQILFLNQMKQAGVRIDVVVYDLLPYTLPHVFDKSMRADFLEWLRVVMQGDGVICISETVAKTLKVWREEQGEFAQHPFDIQWFHLGADLEHSVASYGVSDLTATLLGAMKSKLSFLMVGTLEPRKGHAQVLDAFETLWEHGEDVLLVIVGKMGWMVNTLLRRLQGHPELSKRLFWIEDMSDEGLQQAYQSASCLIAASEGEGFGLPLIEAAKHGLPIIARDLPVFREVAGEHAYYFEGNVARCIQSWIALYQQQQHPLSAEMPWLTWKESAERLKGCLSI